MRELARTVCRNYSQLAPMTLHQTQPCSRRDILLYLASSCAPSEQSVAETVANYTQITSHASSADGLRFANARVKLRDACTPRYERILQCLLQQHSTHGLQLLVALREDLRQWIPLVQQQQQQSNMDNLLLPLQLKQLNSHLLQILSTWFSPGMLQIRRITYESTPASIIETIAVREAVHPVQSLDDLRSRLGSGRRVLALFHPLLPDQPLVILHVSLQPVIPDSMTLVLESPHAHDNNDSVSSVATFYSISSLQPGLAGVGLGEYLIKEAVTLLGQELSTLQHFVTLSPIPRFRKWLEERANASGKFTSTDLIGPRDLDSLSQYLECSPEQVLSRFVDRLTSRGPDIFNDSDTCSWVEAVLVQLAGRYLIHEKHRRKPLDGVARFHIGNGARVHRINPAADLSRKGWQTSFGVMVNYQYDLDSVASNQARYETDYDIPVGPLVADLLND